MPYSVVFTPEARAQLIALIGVFYAGQDYESILQTDS